MDAGLFDALDSAIRSTVSDRDVAVAFSGGLDSGVLAVLCARYAKSVRLYTVGVEGSYDVRASEELSRTLGLEWEHIPIDDLSMMDGLAHMISVTGTLDPIVLSFEVPLMYILPRSREGIVVTGQGADEVFLGYSKYLGLSDEDLRAQLDEDMSKLHAVTRVHENRMAEHYGRTVICPFLDDRVLDAVSKMSLDDLRPKGDDRKMPLREIALELGHPEIASKPKKAAQYGSGAMNTMKRLAKARSMTVGELVDSLRQ